MSEPQIAVPGPTQPPRARRQVFNSLSTRVIFFVFLSTFLTALVVSWISIHAIHSQLRAELDRRFPAILEERVDSIESLSREFERRITRAGADEELVRAVYRSRKPEKLAELLETQLSQMPGFDALMLLDERGVPVASAGHVDSATRQACVLALDGDRAARTRRTPLVIEDPAGAPARAVVVSRLDTPAGPGGWIAGRHGFERFAAALHTRPHEGSARISLVTQDGRVVASGDDAARARIPPGRLARLGAAGVHEYTSDDSEHVLGAAKPLRDERFTLLVEAPFDVAFAPVLSVVSRIFVSDLVIILVFSFLAYKITAAIMQPIRALSDGAQRISQGDYDHAIPESRGNDEIGLLIRTFNDMLSQLRRNSSEIDDDQRRLTEQNEELQRANEVLAQLSITDGLTKLHNHRYFQDHLTREIKRIGRTGEPLSMILMDLDDFKRLNDLYGHAAGDELLVGVANILVDTVRESDLLARYGGEEFVILATGTELEGAIAMAEKIRMSVETSSHIVDDSMRPIRVTLSIGVAAYRGDRRVFFQAADRALYDAKAQGKNCVIAASEPEDDLEA